MAKSSVNRREFLQAAGVNAAVAALGQSLEGATERPNVVLIMADDLGYECLGAYGGTSYDSPFLDRLAQTGIRFQHCYAQPLCTPTRVQLMTGQYNFRNYTGFGVLDPKEKTFGHVMRQAGYRTCVAGKWQLWGASNVRGKGGKGVYPDQAGFDEYCLWQIERVEERYADPLLYRNSRTPQVFQGGYGPDTCCDYISNFMGRNREKAFLVYYPMILPHGPFQPTPDSPEWKTNERKNTHPRFFRSMVTYMDKLVGRIVTRLEKLGLRERTLVMFLADNGTTRGIVSEMRNGAVVGDKGSPTDGGTRVPLIANWPKVIPSGRVSSDLVDTTDFLPTLLEVTGTRALAGMHLDGQSFLPQLKGQRPNLREWVFCHYDPDWGNFRKARFARDQRWKLYDDGRLLDVPADVLERNPILPGTGSQEAEAARLKLQAVLDRMKTQSTAMQAA